MKESNNVVQLKEAIEKILSTDFSIKIKKNLYYELFFDKMLNTSVKDGLTPKRGYSAFQTDLCIFENINGLEFPRIVFECKPGLNSHDILTYSTKAGKHKTVYPSLRYGLYISEIDKIPGKFFIHNEHIDFFIAGYNLKGENLCALVKEIVENEISISKKLDIISFEDSKYSYFYTDIILKDISK